MHFFVTGLLLFFLNLFNANAFFGDCVVTYKIDHTSKYSKPVKQKDCAHNKRFPKIEFFQESEGIWKIQAKDSDLVLKEIEKKIDTSSKLRGHEILGHFKKQFQAEVCHEFIDGEEVDHQCSSQTVLDTPIYKKLMSIKKIQILKKNKLIEVHYD